MEVDRFKDISEEKEIDTRTMINIIRLLQEVDFVDRETLTLKKEIQHNECPFCEVDNGDFVENYQTKQALFYKFKKCNLCQLIYPYPRPNQKTLEGYFQSSVFSNDSRQRFEELQKRREPCKEKGHQDYKISALVKSLWQKSLLVYSYQEFKKYTKKGDKVLDVGAGQGSVAEELIKKGRNVEAVEQDPYRAQHLRKKPGLKVHEGLFSELKFKESSYDAVIFSQVLMHIFPLKETLEKVRRILKPGGLIISSQMNYNSIIQKTIRSPYPGKGLNAFDIVSWFTPESMRTILQKSQFEVTDIIFRPTGLLDQLFLEEYPGGKITKSILRLIDQVVKVVLIKTGTSDYFAVVAKKID